MVELEPDPESSPLQEEDVRGSLRVRSVAEGDPQKEDPNYIPAETADGLERVGSLGRWNEQPPRPEDSFRP
jgi:hypothetical protein